ncbi:DUF4132 domain-containing protein [Streptomyces sioyaensis]|uniref:DUF4132 domain-containing protein n=1 Tax=Streptomyces sioyaensis TaxID=67364 RepID=UPI00364D9691
MSTFHYAEHVETVQRLAEHRDWPALAEEMLRIAVLNDNDEYRERTAVDILRSLPQDDRAALTRALVARYHSVDEERSQARGNALALIGIVAKDLVEDGGLLEARLLWLEGLGAMYILTPPDLMVLEDYELPELVVLAEAELAAGRPLSGAVIGLIRRIVHGGYWYAGPEMVALANKFVAADPVLNPGEAWADQALAELPELGDGWRRLLAHAVSARSARPTTKWQKTGRAVIEELGPPDAVRQTVLSWLPLVGHPRTAPLRQHPYIRHDVNAAFDPCNADALRGLAWLLSLLPPHRDTARALGALAETSLRKVQGLGPRNPSVANAAVLALSRMDGEAALAELARLANRVTYKGTLKQINTALDARAQELGLTRDEIEELAVPAYGLTEVGRAVRRLGESSAELSVRGSKALLTWRNAAGKTVKSAPAAVRRDHPDELKELKAAAKDIDKMLSAQAERLDRQFLARRRWAYAAWRERYLDHPLIGTLARRLLWTVDGQPCGYADGALRGPAGEPVAAAADAPVELWHPIDREPAEVVAWRDWLERHGITQPFKQAHREVYLLTDAERRTRVYSNRFAAHVLRQHQFHSLTAARGWCNKLRLCVNDEFPPATRELPEWGLRAEYWIEGISEDGDTDLSGSGSSYLRLTTDQVRFYPLDAPQNLAMAGTGQYRMLGYDSGAVASLPLDEIPPLVLSEVLRDVDLFVGVASIGNDPTWQDGGPQGRFRDYWTSYSFGELSASAKTRSELLTRLLPRLAIADRCTVEGRFLHVRGALHTYKIHLGSGNILMSPNDAYLCIVPEASESGGTDTYLPFEGDRVLSVILSKAMMLARDTEITDPTITSQLATSPGS